MNKLDLNFVTDGTLDRILDVESRRNHRVEVLMECFRHSIERIHKDTDAMIDHCRAMIRAKLDVTKELDDAETLISAELLVIKLLKREQEKA